MNCIDLGLYRFTGKRSGSEIFSIMGFGDDFINTAPKMITDFWYLLIVFFALIFLMIRHYPKLKTYSIIKSEKKTAWAGIGMNFLLFIVFTGFTFIGFRGGIQYKPLNILSASRYGTGKTAELVLNTSFTIIKTFGKQTIEEINWMTEAEAIKINPVINQPNNLEPFRKKNIIIIILEGIGKEYIGTLNNNIGYTPFLDSLIQKSLVFPNAYANGKRSIEGIPAILAGLPALMHDPFISSAYSGNAVTSVAGLLGKEGYSTIFFHGGTNGTMGFDNFSKLAGFEKYFGRSEYNNDADFDGSWGIYDEPFLVRAAQELDKITTPFLASIFTLSSHHPYKIPEKYANQFPKGTLPIHQSVRYADYSLGKFFENASKMSWYENSLFIITSDHTALSEHSFYRNHVGLFSVPLIMYIPGDTLMQGVNMKTTQQIDILPGLMDYLGYDKPFFAFGESMFETNSKGYAIQFIDDTYQLISDGYIFTLDTLRQNTLYNFVLDSTLSSNISDVESLQENKMELKLKSVVQQFNKAIIHNEMKP